MAHAPNRRDGATGVASASWLIARMSLLRSCWGGERSGAVCANALAAACNSAKSACSPHSAICASTSCRTESGNAPSAYAPAQVSDFVAVHSAPPPISVARSFSRPSRSLLLTVPRGMPRSMAISWCVLPPKYASSMVSRCSRGSEARLPWIASAGQRRIDRVECLIGSWRGLVKCFGGDRRSIAAAATQEANGSVVDDGENIRRESSLPRVEPISLTPNRQERVVHGVLSILAVTQNADGQAVCIRCHAIVTGAPWPVIRGGVIRGSHRRHRTTTALLDLRLVKGQ